MLAKCFRRNPKLCMVVISECLKAAPSIGVSLVNHLRLLPFTAGVIASLVGGRMLESTGQWQAENGASNLHANHLAREMLGQQRPRTGANRAGRCGSCAPHSRGFAYILAPPSAACSLTPLAFHALPCPGHCFPHPPTCRSFVALGGFSFFGPAPTLGSSAALSGGAGVWIRYAQGGLSRALLEAGAPFLRPFPALQVPRQPPRTPPQPHRPARFAPVRGRC